MWPEIDAAEMLERVMALKKVPLFADLQATDLADLARRATPHALCAGAALPLADDGGSVHFLVEGTVSERCDGPTPGRRDAPAVLGVVEVLAGRRPPEHRADVDSRTLEIGRSAFVEVLQDEFEICQATLRHVCAHALPKGLPCAIDPEPARALPAPLTLAERIAWLRRIPPFADLGIHALGLIASDTSEIAFEAGHVFWEAGEPSGHLLAIIAGDVRCTDGDLSCDVGAACVLGLAEALCVEPRGYRLEARSAVRALRLEIEGLIDVLEDDPGAGSDLACVIARGPGCR